MKYMFFFQDAPRRSNTYRSEAIGRSILIAVFAMIFCCIDNAYGDNEYNSRCVALRAYKSPVSSSDLPKMLLEIIGEDDSKHISEANLFGNIKSLRMIFKTECEGKCIVAVENISNNKSTYSSFYFLNNVYISSYIDDASLSISKGRLEIRTLNDRDGMRVISFSGTAETNREFSWQEFFSMSNIEISDVSNIGYDKCLNAKNPSKLNPRF